jgi:hypothetical protein
MMKQLAMTTLALAAILAYPSTAASEFVVVSVTGALEPAELQAGQQLTAGTRLGVEPWGRALIRETSGCELTHVIAGMGDYLLALSEDCSAVDEPIEVVGRIQRGEAFVGRLKQTGAGEADDLVSALSNEPCVFLERVSEEGTGIRRCPSGHALRGLRCTGRFCDDKDLLCCPYLGGAADPSAKETQSRAISEEWPNVLQSKRFLNGLTCDGNYCDNVLAHQFKSARLTNTRSCDWSAWNSEQPAAWIDCRLGRFAAGLRCRGDYCADVGLFCCEARVE